MKPKVYNYIASIIGLFITGYVFVKGAQSDPALSLGFGFFWPLLLLIFISAEHFTLQASSRRTALHAIGFWLVLAGFLLPLNLSTLFFPLIIIGTIIAIVTKQKRVQSKA